MTKDFDVVVVGAGHAGCEAAVAAARLGKKVLLTTLHERSIGMLPCNPSIGGTAKGHLVCEIDALGGIMGILADKAAIQIKMLNAAKGPAVRSLRAQIDKARYHEAMVDLLKHTPNLTLAIGEVNGLIWQDQKITGVVFNGEKINCRAVVVATGTYLQSKTFVGSVVKFEGPTGLPNSTTLEQSFIDMGIEIRRFKTGTPARVDIDSIDYSQTEIQNGDDNIRAFSFLATHPIKNICPCYLAYTNETTHQIIREHIKESAMYSGLIHGVGPRYCPSIEDKITRFADRTRHQTFLERESMSSREIYLQGLSSSLPAEVQSQFIHSIKGLENCQIIRSGYAIEYTCINPLELLASLRHKKYQGLYCAGQINGTSGYEEAAAQGLVAGINASREIDQLPPMVLSRTNAYIGVLIDDLTTEGTLEPYRMFTARAEYRLSLRQDNADERLTPIGREVGLVDDTRFAAFTKKQAHLQKIRDMVTPKIRQEVAKQEHTLADFIKDEPADLLDQITTEIKYAGYIAREQSAIAEICRQEATALSPDMNYDDVKGLRRESQIKLNQIKPLSIGQAARISGVTPADITVLLIHLRKQQEK
ncbi:MAG: tRNA uridine-5-carboxymethylaminomethyl(34) synthesis enzyme MnmG [Eubacteriales bacterium]|nr:tRNA uridine-5-carboxymethylaminomethyl(34) synthesis enzyme MnmG [Eubacteriales bacterium]